MPEVLGLTRGVPRQQNISSSGISFATFTANHTVVSTDSVLLANAASNSITFTLPHASTVTDVVFTFKKIDSSSHDMIVAAQSGETIDGSSSLTTNVLDATFSMSSDGTQFWLLDTPVNGYIIPPTIQQFTSGSGTYTTPANVVYIRVRMVGGGGGGAGSGTSGQGAGGNGGNTTFGTNTAGGGGGAPTSMTASTGGTPTVGSGWFGVALTGGNGATSLNSPLTPSEQGAAGADSPFGGAALSATSSGTGNSAVANSGSGGSGAFGGSGGFTGSGGGAAGAYLDVFNTSPGTSYAYSVGAAGSGGTAGSSGYAGGNGGSGYIIVEEYYQNSNQPVTYVTTPTSQSFTSGSGTYTLPTGPSPKYIKVTMVGGGGGGGGGGSGSGNGAGGSNTTFGTSFLVANGGSGGGGNSGLFSSGGTASLGGAIGLAITGQPGATPHSYCISSLPVTGTSGGSTPIGYGGAAGTFANTSDGNSPADPNCGAGGGGGACEMIGAYGGTGGGAGGYVCAIIINPASTYAYVIGSSGGGGSAGGNGTNGAGGSNGYILVEEFYS